MRNTQTIKGGIGVFALAFAASLLLLLPGCQGPLGTDRAAPETGTVRLALEMPPVGRAILPTITLDDFEYFRLAFSSGTETYTATWGGTTAGTVELPVGEWYLVVTAYLADYDHNDAVLYSGSPISVEVTAGAVTNVGDIELRPVPSADGDYGRFTWNITLPPDATGTMTVTSFDGVAADDSPVNLPADAVGYMDLPVGSHNVLIRLTAADGRLATLHKALYILEYDLLPSNFVHTFADTHFRHPFSGVLGNFITLSGAGFEDADYDWLDYDITAGQTFTALGPLAHSGEAQLEWLEYGDGGLILRASDRNAAAGHSLDLLDSVFDFQENDVVTVRARILPLAAWGGIALNVNTADHAARGQQQANAGAVVSVSHPLDAADIALIRGGLGIRVIGAGAADDVDIFVHGITVHRPASDFEPSTLGDFITLVGMPAQGWQNTTITAGTPVDVTGAQPLRLSGGATLAWADVDGDIVLRMTGRANEWDGVDVRTGAAYNLGLTDTGIYRLSVTGTMATGIPRIQAVPGYAGVGTISWDERAFTITSADIPAASIPTIAFRVNSLITEADGDIDITGITFTRVVVCDTCNTHPCACCPVHGGYPCLCVPDYDCMLCEDDGCLACDPADRPSETIAIDTFHMLVTNPVFTAGGGAIANPNGSFTFDGTAGFFTINLADSRFHGWDDHERAIFTFEASNHAIGFMGIVVRNGYDIATGGFNWPRVPATHTFTIGAGGNLTNDGVTFAFSGNTPAGGYSNLWTVRVSQIRFETSPPPADGVEIWSLSEDADLTPDNVYYGHNSAIGGIGFLTIDGPFEVTVTDAGALSVTGRESDFQGVNIMMAGLRTVAGVTNEGQYRITITGSAVATAGVIGLLNDQGQPISPDASASVADDPFEVSHEFDGSSTVNMHIRTNWQAADTDFTIFDIVIERIGGN